MANKKQTTGEDNVGEESKTIPGGNAGTTGGMSTARGQESLSSGSGRSGIGMSAGSPGSGGTGAGTAVARSFYDQAKETAGQAYEVAAEKATTKLEEQKTNLSGGLASVAGSVRQVSDNLRGPDVQDGISKFTAEYSEMAAQKIEDVANYFERKNVRQMYGDMENFARRNPAVFVGGAFVLGMLAARFLKSGAHTQSGGAFGNGRDNQFDDFDRQAEIPTV